MEYRTNPDGSVTEIPPDTCPTCGAPLGPGNVHLGYDAHPTLERRVRTYRCGACGTVHYDDPPPSQYGPTLDIGDD